MQGVGAGEGRGLAFGEALEGLLDRIAAPGAGGRGEVRVLALIGPGCLAWVTSGGAHSLSFGHPFPVRGPGCDQA